MSEHHEFVLLGKFEVNGTWDGTPTTLKPNENVNLPQSTTGSMVIVAQNTSGQNSTGQLTIVSGGSIYASPTLYGNVNQPTVIANNWNGNNLSLTNTSLPGSNNPIWVSALGPGLGGLKPTTLPMDGTTITLATGKAAQGNAIPTYMQLILQSTSGTLTVVVVIGGPPDATGNNAKVISLNDQANTGPGTPTPAPAGYYATTTSNTYLLSFNWGSSLVFVANESPLTASDLTTGVRRL